MGSEKLGDAQGCGGKDVCIIFGDQMSLNCLGLLGSCKQWKLSLKINGKCTGFCSCTARP